MARSVLSDGLKGGYSLRRVNVAIAVAQDARERIYEVAATCRALGLEHTSTLTDIGVLMGSVELDNLSTLRDVPGVLAVELEREFRIRGLRARGD